MPFPHLVCLETRSGDRFLSFFLFLLDRPQWRFDSMCTSKIIFPFPPHTPWRLDGTPLVFFPPTDDCPQTTQCRRLPFLSVFLILWEHFLWRHHYPVVPSRNGPFPHKLRNANFFFFLTFLTPLNFSRAPNMASSGFSHFFLDKGSPLFFLHP